MQDLIKKLVSENLGINISSSVPLSGGQVGNVFRVSTDEKSYVVKFVKAKVESSFSTESVNDRVYGSRWSNLLPTYNLLETKNISTPKLYASGTLRDENLHYAIFDYLEGDESDFSSEWFASLGHSVGSVHAVTRPYQGWPSLNTPYEEDWASAFQESIWARVKQSEQFINPNLNKALSTYIKKQLIYFTSPKHFVLSHTDGFQGVFKKENNDWNLLGVIDIEDYQFTDQRFVLSGIELTHAIEGHPVPSSFWEAYSGAIPIDQSFSDFKLMFQIYYLLVWIRVLQGQDFSLTKCVDYLESLIR